MAPMGLCKLLGIAALVLWIVGLCGAPVVAGVADSRTPSTEAYVTLLYGDEFLLGVRVLGKSIRDTGTSKDMVVLVSDGVSDYAKTLLRADGWIVEMISLLANPNQVRPKRFWGVYTKLKIFNMTKYKKVVFLDADTIVVKNIDDLFKCSKFCANLKHSERLNSGVMVVEPSEKLFKDMMSKVKTLFSYTGGDQGFLNSYYEGFASARLFDPEISPEVLKSRPVPEMERLSTLYNADVGLYMLANKWMVDEKELRVIHYTLGPLKPWDWWTSWLVKPVDVWQNIRVGLEESLPGTQGGKNPKDELIIKFLFLLPFVLLLIYCYRTFLQGRSLTDRLRHINLRFRTGSYLPYSPVAGSTISTIVPFSDGDLSKVPAFLGGMSVLVCFLAAVISLGISVFIIPRQVTPWTGVLLVYEWTFTIFFLFFGSYLQVIARWGKTVASREASISSPPGSPEYDSRKGHRHHMSSCDYSTCYYGFGMAFLAVLAPSLPFILGFTALFLKLGLMVLGGFILVSFMTYSAEHLAIRSFLKGLDDRAPQRSSGMYPLC